MIINSETYADFTKYYLGTFIIVPEAVPNEVALVRDVGSESCRLSYKNDEDALIIYGPSGYEVKSPLLSRKQFFNVENTVFCISRIPARMWKKGVSKENTVIYNAIHPTLSGVPINITNLNSFLENKDKFKSLSTMEVGQNGALNKDWAVLEGNLVFKEWPVGITNFRRKALTISREFSVFLPKELVPFDWRINLV